jgi:hypothetical protein
MYLFKSDKSTTYDPSGVVGLLLGYSAWWITILESL